MGKLLRVDLTSGHCEPIELPEEPILRKYWGGQALGTYILLNEMSPGVEAYSPESMITMMTGPVTAELGTEKAKLALQEASVVVFTKPRNVCPWPFPDESQALLAKNSILN